MEPTPTSTATRKKLFGFLSLSTATLMIAGILAIIVPSSASAAPTNCVPVAMMAMRGSSEEPIPPATYSPNQVSNGYEGAIITRLLWGLTWHYGTDPALKDIPVIGLTSADGYVAAGLPESGIYGALSPGSDFFTSAVNGAAAVINKMDSFQATQDAACPKTKWVLLGFSQGSMVARWAYAEAPNRIASLYLIGDPFQEPNKQGNIGNGNGGSGVITALITGDYTPISR